MELEKIGEENPNEKMFKKQREIFKNNKKQILESLKFKIQGFFEKLNGENKDTNELSAKNMKFLMK